MFGIPIHDNVFTSLNDLVKNDDVNVSSFETLNSRISSIDNSKKGQGKRPYHVPQIKTGSEYVTADKTVFQESSVVSGISGSNNVNVPAKAILNTHRKGLKVCSEPNSFFR